ncbi:hypothetical protein DFJ73DRAFT_271468 [Zopfochytrium polystomum]|nr:hypothetical protein DFJ73DRAFT_271468 [Zopfochytrium polystomum]
MPRFAQACFSVRAAHDPTPTANSSHACRTPSVGDLSRPAKRSILTCPKALARKPTPHLDGDARGRLATLQPTPTPAPATAPSLRPSKCSSAPSASSPLASSTTPASPATGLSSPAAPSRPASTPGRPASAASGCARKRSIHLLRSGFRGRLPPEIVQAVDRLAAWTDSQTVELDRALFEHLCRSESPYGSSDIDVFFVCPEGAMDVSAACRTLPKVQAAVVRNRQAVDVRKFLDSEEHENHWVFSDLDHRYDWFTETISGERRYSSRYSWHGGSPEYQRDERGWSPIMLERLRARLRLLWTVRTTNSVTVTGVHPVRHTQLMLPVVRSAEQVWFLCVPGIFD